jgi:RNA-splicing ligase RtcB
VTNYYVSEGAKLLKEKGKTVPYEMTYLEGDLMQRYLHDVKIVQMYALANSSIIYSTISKYMKFKYCSVYNNICNPHNYIETYDKEIILRKGAISAREGEDVIIPINMRDGVILGKGLGNPDWNYSAPHGAGRIYSRSEVKNHYTVSDFKKEMKGIYSSCIGSETLDEAPFAYRDIEYVKEAIKDTVEITDILKPVYNFKAGN